MSGPTPQFREQHKQTRINGLVEGLGLVEGGLADGSVHHKDDVVGVDRCRRGEVVGVHGQWRGWGWPL